MAKATFTPELLTAIRTQEWREHELDLSDQELKPQEVIALVDALGRNPFIQSLNLYRCKINDVGAQALAGNKTLTTLDVSCNQIGSMGAKALAASKTLLTLKVGYNKIAAVGAKALASNRTLTTLDVSANEIDKNLQQQLELVLAQNRKRLSNQAALAVAVACYRANSHTGQICKLGAIIKLIPAIHDYAGFQKPTVAMGEVIGTNFFKRLAHIPPSPAPQKASSAIEQKSESNLVRPTEQTNPRTRCQQ